jgi:[protein-PII] uridylyltransferase
MRSTGFLAVILPEWERIDHLVVRDFYHQYTVDEHTLVTIDVLAALKDAKEPAAVRFAELMAESSDQLWLLQLALLLHDTGKGSGRDHSQCSGFAIRRPTRGRRRLIPVQSHPEPAPECPAATPGSVAAVSHE